MLRWSVWGRRRTTGAGAAKRPAYAKTSCRKSYAGPAGWSCAAALVLSLSWASSAAAQDVPFDAIVVEGEVIVRAGAGNAYYEVGRLERGASVRVEEVLYGWNRIEPPEGVYSFVSKMNVDARGDGRVGEVNTNRVDVTAANVAGPGQSYRRQLVLHEGEAVRIVGEEGSFYKIEPPQGAPVYLPPGSVRRADSEEALAIQRDLQAAGDPEAAAQQAEVEEPQADPAQQAAEQSAEQAEARSADEASEQAAAEADDSESAAEQANEADQASEGERLAQGQREDAAGQADEAEQEEVAAAEAAEVSLAQAEDAVVASEAEAPGDMAQAEAAEAEAVETPAVTPELREVELRNIPLAMQPLEDQPLDQMIADYRGVLDEVPDLPARDRRLARMRIATFEDNQRRAEVLTRIQSIRRASEQRQQAELAADTGEPAAEQPREPRTYDYKGRLLASAVYDGHTLPRLYRLVDTGSGRTIAYVEPGDAVEPHRMLGRRVGVDGQREYHDALGLYVFNTSNIDVLEGLR